MNRLIPPSKRLIAQFSPTAAFNIPGDKSLSHRAALFSALAEGESMISNFLDSGVTHVMLTALSALDIEWTLDANTLVVHGKGLNGFTTPAEPLYCGHSATTIRLLAGAVAASGIGVTLDGSPGLRKRPMDRIIDPLRKLGVEISASNTGTAPLVLTARDPRKGLLGGTIQLSQASAQVKTCVLLAGLAAQSDLIIHEPGPSRDHSERMLKSMGVPLQINGLTIRMPQFSTPLQPLSLRLPGDISAAAFLIVAAIITPESNFIFEEVGLNPTRTGLLDVLTAMGANLDMQVTSQIAGELTGRIIARSSKLNGITVSGDLVVRMIDEFPIFAVAAACAEGETVVKDAGELRYKESDRIKALCQQLQKIGIKIRETQDGFIIQGNQHIPGGTAQSCGDHRLAMSLAVAGLASKHGVSVEGANIINQSFPAFFDLLQHTGTSL
ncbi:MAG: 3-phosphoshikimate 1-carboxyvinyltransferase [Chloroflexi bacterium HGW-Chloroflexi-3]|nr:MAG: 3-phosphoshikimate 1-carboxyvinyltransferase [Chloroflexi bacterium HGW-Chloroflexi-3]